MVMVMLMLRLANHGYVGRSNWRLFCVVPMHQHCGGLDVTMYGVAMQSRCQGTAAQRSAAIAQPSHQTHPTICIHTYILTYTNQMQLKSATAAAQIINLHGCNNLCVTRLRMCYNRLVTLTFLWVPASMPSSSAR
jgi:hypothetical protein